MKNKKLIGLASLMLVLGATGCPKTDDPVEKPKCEKHTWGEKVTIKEATCTEAGQTQRTCTVCGEKEDPRTVKALGHDWEDDATGGKAATCTEKGSKGQHCKRCSETRTVDIDPLGHKWVDDETGGVPATCETAGSKNQHCERCDAKQEGVVVEALGHDYGEWTTVEGKAPKCEEKGEEKHVCSRCSKEETREVAALGHNFQLIGDDTEPEAGKAKVRLYTCANEGCGKTSLGFKANEVSDESKTHLVIGTDGGASFWGRPIGNSLALDANGDSVNKKNNEVVYCSTETGDFFEYVFDLTEEQANELATCRCYCDAKPANYLSGDFWAYNASADDWTPGYYIDGADEHVEKDADNKDVMVEDHARCDKDSASAGDALGEDHMVKMGKRITDYRYVLYVDNQIQEFDPDTKVTVEGSGTNTVRKEYEMPFTFHLHKGENRISLRMAGGYRSTFYNFTFRPYVEKTQITVDQATLEVEEGLTAPITGASQEGVTYTSDKESVATVDANGVVTGVKPGTATITVAKEGNFKPAKVTVTVTKSTAVHEHTFGDPADVAAGEGTVAYTKADCACGGVKLTIDASKDMNGKITERGKKLGATGDTAKYVINTDKAYDGKLYLYAGVDTNGNQEYGFHTGKNGGSSAVDLPDGKTNTEFFVNGNKVNVSTAKYKDFGIEGKFDAATMANVALIEVGDVYLANGNNEITMTRKDSFGVNVWDVVFIGKEHVHNYVATPVEAADGAMAYNKEVCACGSERMALAALAGTFAEGSSNKDGNPDGFLKLNGNGNSISYAFKAAAAGNVKIAIETVMDDFTRNGGNNSKTLKSSKGSAKYNITFAVGENEVDMTAIEDKLYSELYPSVPEGEEPIKAQYSAITTFELGTVAVAEGLNTLKITRNGSYNFIIS
jgi:hypothetical protein